MMNKEYFFNSKYKINDIVLYSKDSEQCFGEIGEVNINIFYRPTSIVTEYKYYIPEANGYIEEHNIIRIATPEEITHFYSTSDRYLSDGTPKTFDHEI